MNFELIDFKNRFYSPHLGRWLNPDPIEHLGGINLYNYDGNDPINNIDPFGNCIIRDFQAQCDLSCDREGVGGIVLCCEGVPRACLCTRRLKDPTVEACVGLHEQTHLDDLGPNGCKYTVNACTFGCVVARPKDRNTHDQSECNAYTAGIACLGKSCTTNDQGKVVCPPSIKDAIQWQCTASLTEAGENCPLPDLCNKVLNP